MNTAAEIRTMFSAIAGDYDRANTLLSGPLQTLWRRAAVAALEPSADARILDACCGTGDLSLEISRHVPTGSVVGADFSPEMIERAHTKNTHDNVEFVVGDATSLEFEDNSFDGATVSFGIRNVVPPIDGLRELARVVRPGGRVVVLEFGQPEGFLFRPIFRTYSRWVMPLIGQLATGHRKAYEYLPRTAAAFPAGQQFVEELMAPAGLVDCSSVSITRGVAWVYTGYVPNGGEMNTTVLVLKPDADIANVRAALARRGATGTVVSSGLDHMMVVQGPLDVRDLPEVARVLEAPSKHPYVDDAPEVLDISGVRLGHGVSPVLIAGPCAIEDEETLERIAAAVVRAGGQILRGGAFKPRTSPYSFQGLGVEGLHRMRDVADRYDLKIVTEVMSENDVSAVAECADLIQVGSRSMQHFPLLRAVGRSGRPVMLKRGASATVEEWLFAAEYLLESGASGVALCERGIRTFGRSTRYTLDLSTVAWLLEHSRLPVIVDPSHATGHRELVPRLARAVLALGAHGLMLDVHTDPGLALCDGPQALDLSTFKLLEANVV